MSDYVTMIVDGDQTFFHKSLFARVPPGMEVRLSYEMKPWADPLMVPEAVRLKYAGNLDECGRPVAPPGAVSDQMRFPGRKLGKWGANLAADPIVLIRKNDRSVHLLAIERGDTPGVLAFPGGMIDPTDRDAKSAAMRELCEEALPGKGLDILLPHVVQGLDGVEVYRGPNFSDPRNTTNAWMETSAYVWLFQGDEAYDIVSQNMQARDDAKTVRLVPVASADGTWRRTAYKMYSDHAKYLDAALDKVEIAYRGPIPVVMRKVCLYLKKYAI